MRHLTPFRKVIIASTLSFCTAIIIASPTFATPSITLENVTTDSTITQIDAKQPTTARGKVQFKFNVQVTDASSYSVYLSTPTGTMDGRSDPTNNHMYAMVPGVSNVTVDGVGFDYIPAGQWGYRYSGLASGTSGATIATDAPFMPPKVATNNERDTIGFVSAIGSGNTFDNTVSETKNFLVEVAAAAGRETNADTYDGKVTISVVATPAEANYWWSKGAQYMQSNVASGFTADICNNAPIGAVGSLTDDRVNNTSKKKFSYIVAKLADGNCWMIQNLALEGGTTITPEDSNVEEDYTLPKSTANFLWNGTQQMFNGSHKDSTYDTAGCNGTTGVNACTASGHNNSGAYYTFYVATIKGADDFSNATHDICPKGWELPTSNKADNVDKSFNKLYSNPAAGYGDNKELFASVWRPGYTGRFNNSELISSGAESLWWSSTTSDGVLSYTLTVFSDDTDDDPNAVSNRHYGRAVRCVFAG